MSILDSHKVEIARLQTAGDLAFGAGATPSSEIREDQAVIFPLGRITWNLCEEVLFYVEHGCGFGALRTSRTLYECVIFSLYMSKHPETCKSYLDSWNAHWAQVIRNVRGVERNLPEIHKTLSEKVPAYAQGRSRISLDWNDERTTFNMAMDVGISREFHSLGFNYASAFVHPTPILLTSSLAKRQAAGQPVLGNEAKDQEIKFALQITHDLIINAIRLRLKYSNNGSLGQNLADCEKDFVNIWGYQPQLTTI
jgi:hypothetical protein